MIRTPLTENGLEWLDTQIWYGQQRVYCCNYIKSHAQKRYNLSMYASLLNLLGKGDSKHPFEFLADIIFRSEIAPFYLFQ